MNTLQPAETYYINRILQDHTDSTTYYVQAKIYDGATRVLLATKNLTDNGSRWFSSTYKVPNNNSYVGKRLIVVTSVFTDSGYTTKSENHGDEPEEYIITPPVNQNLGGGGGSIDEITLKRIMTEVLNSIEKPEQVDMEAFKLQLIKALLPSIHRKIDSAATDIKGNIPEPHVCTPPDPVDLTPIHEGLIGLGQALNTIAEKFKTVDFAPVLNEVRNLAAKVDQNHSAFIDESKKSFQNAKMELMISHSMAVTDTPEEIAQKNKDKILGDIRKKFTK